MSNTDIAPDLANGKSHGDSELIWAGNDIEELKQFLGEAALKEQRQRLLKQLEGRTDQLTSKPTRRVAYEETEQPSPRNTDEILAEETGETPAYIRAARRLIRTGNAELIILWATGQLPLTTALRAGRPVKANARVERWRHLVALCGS